MSTRQKVFIYVDRGSERGYLLGLKKDTPLHEVKSLIGSNEEGAIKNLIQNSHSMNWVPRKNKRAVSQAAHFVVGKEYTAERLA